MLQNALEGSSGSASSSAYMDAYRTVMRMGVGDKSFIVRIAAARCLRAFANIGGPGLGVGEIENSSAYCVKSLEDSIQSVRDSFAEALGALLALGMNQDAQAQPRGKGQFTPKRLEGGLQKYLASPFMKASGPRLKELRVGITLSWVSFLQTVRQKYFQSDSDLQNFAPQIIDMLHVDVSCDAQALACVLYILRVGITDQMSEPTQRDFLVFLCKQLQSAEVTPFMLVASMRTLSHVLKTLGEVPLEFKDLLDNTVVAALSYDSPLVRIEAALTLRALAEVDPSCVGGLISYAVTMLNAARENISFEKGANLKLELDSLHGQAAILAALVSVSPKLPLGYPARLPKSVLEVSKKMLMESTRNPASASVEREAGWALLSSMLASMPKEELDDQVFDILSLWTSLFGGNDAFHFHEADDHTPTIGVWSSAVDALTAFIKCFVSSDDSNHVLLQPILLYLSRALSYISAFTLKEHTSMKAAMDIFTIKTLRAYQSLPDPAAYRNDHSRIVQICTAPFRDSSKFEASSCLRMLLDKRDAWLGPWVPGRDLFEDELRSFQGGKDGVLPCVWDNDPPSFPQPETVGKMLVNQMLLCFGIMFASQDSGGMLSLLSTIEQCLKAGKKKAWHAASVTNICVGLLAGLKALLALRPEPLGMEILNATQSIFQSILAEGDICASQRRASSEGLGLLARLGNDIFTARLTRSLLGDVSGTVDSNYTGSIALALGCIHCSAGGMALSSLVPTTVNFLSSHAKSPMTGLQIWSLHGLLLTIEAAGLSYVSQVQATLVLAMDILLSQENGSVDLQQGLGRLINAVVAVLGPELAPGSIFFSRCKSVVAEISSCQETATLLESVRFTQQLVLFAPQAVSVHEHVQSLLPTLSSRQPNLRNLALSTLRHLIEKDPGSVIEEQIEESLFHMLDEETDNEIGNLARMTIMRLLYASCPSRPSHWLSICRDMILAMASKRELSTNRNLENESSTDVGGDDDDNMVSHSQGASVQDQNNDFSGVNSMRVKHLRYRTRVFAAECLSHVPEAVGSDLGHFNLSIAKEFPTSKFGSEDWLVLKLQDLISLAYQISTIQFENMRPIGVALLSTIVDKFGMIPDPELPGHILLEQNQAQLVSAVRTALDSLSGPTLLEAGLQLATKILTSGVISQDQNAVKRIFSLISRPLDDFNDLYYPSFAEWVSCKIKVRLLTAHASLKCYTYTSFKDQQGDIPKEYQALLPLFSNSSRILGPYWLSLLKDYSYICFNPYQKNWKPFLDGVQSHRVSAILRPCLEEAWPLILQALSLDAFPINFDANGSLPAEHKTERTFTSGYSMVELKEEDFQFLYGFSLLALFQGQGATPGADLFLDGRITWKFNSNLPVEDGTSLSPLKPYGIILPVFQSLLTKRFFGRSFVSLDLCKELLQVITYTIFSEDTWDNLAVYVLSQIVQNCPKEFLETENFFVLASELCFAFLFKFHLRKDVVPHCHSKWEIVSSVSLTTATTLLQRCEFKMQLKSMLGFLLVGYKCVGGSPSETCLSRANEFVQSITSVLKGFIKDNFSFEDDVMFHLTTICSASLNAVTSITKHCIRSIHDLENRKSISGKLLQMKLAFSFEQCYSIAKFTFDLEKRVENDQRSSIVLSVLHQAIQCARVVLTDDDTQVQTVGLQVLKGMLQRGMGADVNNFLLFFSGELIPDISLVMQKSLQTIINREAVTITGECLRILMLLQTLPKENECKKGLISLIVEVVMMIISTLVDHTSEEANELRSTAIKIVSQLAQIPSTAPNFKAVLVTMPITQRQKLQDIIRASVTQEQSSAKLKPGALPLPIKLPAQTENKEKAPPPEPVKEISDNSEEEEDDDWDNFQSFPASTNEPGPASDIPDNIVESSYGIVTDNVNNESSSSLQMTENTSDERKYCDVETSNDPDSSDHVKEPHDLSTDVMDDAYLTSQPITVADENISTDRKSTDVGTADDPDSSTQIRDHHNFSADVFDNEYSSSQSITVVDEITSKDWKSSDVVTADEPYSSNEKQESHDFNTDVFDNKSSSSQPITVVDEIASKDWKSSDVGTADDPDSSNQMQECHDFNTDVHHNEYSSSEPITEADENTSVDRKSSN
ncbi:hypothetical protein Leryth_018528, partial [Lithospermum erythrorhizon]